MASENLEERLLAKTEISPDGCWIWFGVKTRHGYGYMRYSGGRLAAHRASYLVYLGPIPNETVVCHSCDTPACVRPDHLFLGTQAENMRDMTLKGRRARGERLPQSKLTEVQVSAIRGDSRTHEEIAATYGVSRPTVSRVINRKTWKDINT